MEGLCFLHAALPQAPPGIFVIHDFRASVGNESFTFLTYQLPTIGYWPTLAMTGNGELGFDTGEGA